MVLITLTLVLCGCATKKALPQPQGNSFAPLSTNQAPSPKRTQAVLSTPAPLIHAEDESLLKNKISEWIESHQPNSLPEVAQAANILLQKFGYPMVLDAAHLLKGKNSLTLSSKGKSFVFSMKEGLSRGEEFCGERYLQITALPTSPDHALLFSKGKTYPFSLKPFRREIFLLYSGKKQIAQFYAPEPGEPIGVAENGKAIYLKFPLHVALASTWWMKVTQHLPSLLGEDPYLILKVEKGKLTFDDTLANLVPQEFEVEEGTPNTLRWKFLPSRFVLVLSSRCGVSKP